MDETEKTVLDLVETYNDRSIFTFKRYPLKHNTDLNEDFRMDPLDAYDLLEEFTERFSINLDESISLAIFMKIMAKQKRR
ncbi:DUF1493 family protein [Pantoea sp. JZ2]|uniref:DUF1493 family protein n=1 Tax=Pantoea sp. JZ2 TaxID=2654189 RepID=UPI002B46945D|nr:DUF1493 family protein [Pantoea sp. JZ2]